MGWKSYDISELGASRVICLKFWVSWLNEDISGTLVSGVRICSACLLFKCWWVRFADDPIPVFIDACVCFGFILKASGLWAWSLFCSFFWLLDLRYNVIMIEL